MGKTLKKHTAPTRKNERVRVRHENYLDVHEIHAIREMRERGYTYGDIQRVLNARRRRVYVRAGKSKGWLSDKAPWVRIEQIHEVCCNL